MFWADYGRAKCRNADSLICLSIILRLTIRPAHHPAVGQDQKLDTVTLNRAADSTTKIIVHSLRRCHPDIFKELRVTRCQYWFEPFRSIEMVQVAPSTQCWNISMIGRIRRISGKSFRFFAGTKPRTLRARATLAILGH